MKKILLGCGAIVLLALSVPSYTVIKYQVQRQLRQADCNAVQPTIDIAVDVIAPFLEKVIEGKETPALALQTAAKVEAALPKLALIKLKDPSLKNDHQLVLATWDFFVSDTRAWASAPQGITYMKFVSKRTIERPRAFRNISPGGYPMFQIVHYCD